MLDPKLNNNFSPLKGEQLTMLQSLLNDMSSIQTAWVSGYLAVITQQNVTQQNVTQQNVTQQNDSFENYSETAVTDLASDTVTILYGSQTGNATAVAQTMSQHFIAQGYHPQIFSMDEYNVRNISKETFLFIVISTHGEGEPPENAASLHAYLHGKRAVSLSKLKYAVLGLGDSSYSHFCQAAKQFDERLNALGATRLLDCVECDIDYSEKAQAWSMRAHNIIKELVPAKSAKVVSIQGGLSVGSTQYNKASPYKARLLDNTRLTTHHAHAEVRHLVLSVDPQEFQYTAGDALGIWFRNDPALVDTLLKDMQISGEVLIDTGGEKIAIKKALLEQFELTRLHPGIIKSWSKIADDKQLNTLVLDEKQLANYVHNNQVVDLVNDFPAKTDAASFCSILHPITPRLYSIASSPLEYDDEIHLTVSVSRQHTDRGEKLGGASAYLAQRLAEDDHVDVYLVKNNTFRLPDDQDRPIIMIGAGTGIAPFRAFMQQRAAAKRAAANSTGKSWLIFGNRNFHDDFLYQLEWQRYYDSSSLTKIDLAFSRDQEKKIYVQQRLYDNGSELFRWFEEGAYIYLCGSVPMGHDVQKAILDIIRVQGKLTADQASKYLDNLRLQGRLQKEVY